MKTFQHFLFLTVAITAICCTKDIDNGREIETDAEAREIFYEFANYFKSIEYDFEKGQINMEMPSSTGQAGAEGQLSVTKTSSSSRSYNSRILDVFIDFDDYLLPGSTLQVNGVVRFFAARSSRTACSSSGCASSSDHSRAVETRPFLRGEIEHIIVTYQLSSGVWINDEISIDASSADYTTRWTSIEFKTKSGHSFSIDN